MTDEQIERIAAGEHPFAVLAPTRDLFSGSRVRDGEILQSPPAPGEPSAD